MPATQRRVQGGTAKKLFAAEGRAVLAAGFHPVSTTNMLMSGGGAAAVVKGGNSARAERAAKRNRYGQDTYKMRLPQKFQYALRLFTYTTSQASVPGTSVPATPTTDTPATAGYNVAPEGATLTYLSLAPRTNPTNGQVTMNAQGLYWSWAEELPDVNRPWLQTYFGFKLDMAGFNICDPTMFAQNCSRYMFAKQGPACATFVWPDCPIGRNDAVTREIQLAATTFTGVPATGNGTVSAYGTATREFRGIGPWEMIIIPPRKMKSINIDNCLNQDGWDALIDMGFKPRPCQKVTKIYCSNGGVDATDINVITNAAAQAATRNSNVPSGLADTKWSNISGLRYKKMSYVDTEDICQYTNVPDIVAGTLPPTTYALMSSSDNIFFRQGYPTVPFGSAIVFRIRQFAPVQETYTAGARTITQTCIRQNLPLDVYLDSVTVFKSPVKGSFDLDLPQSDPSQA